MSDMEELVLLDSFLPQVNVAQKMVYIMFVQDVTTAGKEPRNEATYTHAIQPIMSAMGIPC